MWLSGISPHRAAAVAGSKTTTAKVVAAAMAATAVAAAFSVKKTQAGKSLNFLLRG